MNKDSVILALIIFFIVAVAFILMGINANKPGDIQVTPPPVEDNSTNEERNINPEEAFQTECDSLKIIAPLPDTTVENPVEIQVVIENKDASCNWTVFEAVAGSVAIEDSEGRVLGTEILKTSGDWMSENAVFYNAVVNFKNPHESETISLVIRETNISGIEEDRNEMSIPLDYIPN